MNSVEIVVLLSVIVVFSFALFIAIDLGRRISNQDKYKWYLDYNKSRSLLPHLRLCLLAIPHLQSISFPISKSI